MRNIERCDTLFGMNTPLDRQVLVPASRLDELLELARIASERLDPADALCMALRGAAADVRALAVLEPELGGF